MATAAKQRPGRGARGYVHVDIVNVYLWGQHLGAVARDPGFGYYAFAYTQAFCDTGIQPAPLHMPAKSQDEVFLFTDLPEATYKRLPALLSDALPDDFGNALIDRYMADKGLRASDVTALDRLAYMAGRSMGALEFRPTRGPANKTATSIELSSLVTEARKAVAGAFHDDEHTNAALRSIIDVGTSAGGARAKAVIAWNPQWACPPRTCERRFVGWPSMSRGAIATITSRISRSCSSRVSLGSSARLTTSLLHTTPKASGRTST